MDLNETSTFNVETQFANVLQNYELNNGQSPVDVLISFKSISASKALEAGERLELNPNDNDAAVSFENWDLETKLWHLAEILYSFRFSENEEPLKEYTFSSLSTKEENFLRKTPKLRELLLIIEWLQVNSKSSDANTTYQSKWPNTRIAAVNGDLKTLSGGGQDLVTDLDEDAPIRTLKNIDHRDEEEDSRNFKLIYQLLISNKIQEAIDYASRTENFALSLILLGAIQDYMDSIIDSDGSYILGALDSQHPTASGIKHKLLWKNTVYKLSQESKLSRYERLIYNYLSGGEISANLFESSGSWEESLLLYLNQLYLHNLETFIRSTMSLKELQMESLPLSQPTPQFSSVEGILNALLRSENEVAEQSRHPIRIISGSIMIDQLQSLLRDLLKDDRSEIMKHPNLARILVHLALVYSFMVEVDLKDLTSIITSYISKLVEYDLSELATVYLLLIPDERDAREAYSLFLSSITDTDERSKQILIAKRFSSVASITKGNSKNDLGEEKIANVLRRTVERVMEETESQYRPSSTVSVVDDNEVDETDYRLYRSVDWFFENSMYEDAIKASIVVIRRFLLCGKLSSLKQFAQEKDFKKLIKDYDFVVHTKTLIDPQSVGSITEDQKQELLEYAAFATQLVLVDDWKRFLTDHLMENSAAWKSKDVRNSIEKITKSVTGLIYKWFKDLIESSDDKVIFEELRSMYIPYMIMEILLIYQAARLNDPKYVKEAFKLVGDVANDNENDFLKCFKECGRLQEFLVKVGEFSILAAEKGIKNIFT
ncbi:uncharacterized protein PRCAT00000497001 [Priceomyces carsonii]|uniref:uncharacterized protein n=1 Tax=Priceomyces carsonii TaxID=28549 RepID=UPI002ED7C42D|nr:unnamed protein product [Priceomyces carsonii]